MPKDVTRRIKERVSSRLWAMAAGRCEFDGCNIPLWRSLVTQEPINAAERAHIWSFSEDGPRGNDGIEDIDLNEADNLLLVCHGCHEKIDQCKDGGRYSVDLLRAWKGAHEARIELVTGISSDKRSHIVLYGANVGRYSAPLSARATMPVLFPCRYPASATPIQLGMVNSAWDDRSDEFWKLESGHLRASFESRLRPSIALGEIQHVSLFGFAPQPLLVLLGSLLTDICPADVYPLLREPQGWGWDDDCPDAAFEVHRPKRRGHPVALVISLSATVTHDRIERVLGSEAAVWELSVAERHNDVMRSRSRMRMLRQHLRPTLDAIKAEHGQDTVLHIFPAMSTASAVELGRIRMPKADMPWQMYDQINGVGFVPAIAIGDRHSE